MPPRPERSAEQTTARSALQRPARVLGGGGLHRRLGSVLGPTDEEVADGQRRRIGVLQDIFRLELVIMRGERTLDENKQQAAKKMADDSDEDAAVDAKAGKKQQKKVKVRRRSQSGPVIDGDGSEATLTIA